MKKLIYLAILLIICSCSKTEDDIVLKDNTSKKYVLSIPTWLKGNFKGSNNGANIIQGDNLIITDSTIVRRLTRVTLNLDGTTFTDYWEEFNMSYFNTMSQFKEEYGVSNGFRYYKIFAFDSVNGDYGLRLYIEEKSASRIYWWKTEYRNFIKQ